MERSKQHQVKVLTTFPEIIACNDCGKLFKRPELINGTIAQCDRCGAKLFYKTADTANRTLALSLACLILFVIANIYPFLNMRIEGIVQETKMITGIVQLYRQGMPLLALLVLSTAMIFPLLQIIGMIYLLLPLKLGYLPRKAALIFRTLCHLKAWGMIEVYLLGILVSMIKLAKMATVIPGLASIAFIFLIFLLAAVVSGLNPDDIWKHLPVKIRKKREPDTQNSTVLVSCHTCSFLSCLPKKEVHHICPRCEASLHLRKTNSIRRTWALVITAIIFYFPANMLPITFTSALGHEQADTILSGVIYFMFSGSWHIALIIFIASVIIPIMKILILIYLLLSVQFRSVWKPKDRTRLYRITEAVGRWSMVDVYVVTILVAMVQMGPLASIEAGMGAVYFSAVVVSTMFAAENFDPRLIWDVMEESNEHV